MNSLEKKHNSIRKILKDNICLIQYDDNSYYIGNLEDDKLNGYGKYWSKTIKCHGIFANNQLNGAGILELQNKTFEGNFKNNKLQGIGKEFIDNFEYRGEFVDGLKHGKGQLYKNNFVVFDGLWHNNEILNDGKDIILLDQNQKIKYKCNEISFNDKIIINGKVEEYQNKNNIHYLHYQGEVVDNQKNGLGIIYELDNKTNKSYILYEGLFNDDKLDGKGILYNSDYSIFYSGLFENGKIPDGDVIINKLNDYTFIGEISSTYNYKSYIPIINFIKGTYENNINRREIKVTSDKFKNNNITNNCNLKIEIKFDQDIINFEGKIINNYFEGNYISKCNSHSPGVIKNISFNGKILIQNDLHKHINHIIYSFIRPEFKYGIITCLNTNKILSEGNYNWNQQLQGEGKKYENGILIQEGNFSNGLLHLQGKTYYSNGQLEYSGEFHRGYRHGNGTLYSNYGTIIYSGNFNYNDIS